MARTKKNHLLQKEMSARLKHVVINCLGYSIEDCSKELGYANSSSIRKALDGKCFIDPEKLFLLSKISNQNGQIANIHWIITGHGTPLLTDWPKDNGKEVELDEYVSTLSVAKKNALAVLLS